MAVDVTTKSLRCGEGSGISMGSRWQLGSRVECISLRRGCVFSASEWWVGVIGKVLEEAEEWIVDAISKIGVSAGAPAVASRCEEA